MQIAGNWHHCERSKLQSRKGMRWWNSYSQITTIWFQEHSRCLWPWRSPETNSCKKKKKKCSKDGMNTLEKSSLTWGKSTIHKILKSEVRLALDKVNGNTPTGSVGIVLEMVSALYIFRIDKISKIIKYITVVIYWKTLVDPSS